MVHDEALELMELVTQKEIIKSYQEAADFAAKVAMELTEDGSPRAGSWQKIAAEYSLQTQWRLTALLYPEE